MNIEAIEESINKEYNGFKIPKSHFKIGSKIHLNDFFYAKKMFQNTFYAHKFAFTTAKYILNNETFLKKVEQLRVSLNPHSKNVIEQIINNASLFDAIIPIAQTENSKEIDNQCAPLEGLYEKDDRKVSSIGISVIGYGMYSELLVNRIERLLDIELNREVKKGEIKIPINHDMVSDVEDPKLIMNERLYNTIIIIVPISTTFSTSYKMLKMLNESYVDLDIVGPIINLVLVSHGNLEDEREVNFINDYLKTQSEGAPSIAKETETKDAAYLPYKLFKWEKISFSERIVTVLRNKKLKDIEKVINTDQLPNSKGWLNEPDEQRYFITLPNEWHLMDDCRLCYPISNKVSTILEGTGKIGIEINEIPLLETDKASVTPNLLFTLPKTQLEVATFSEKDVLLNPNSYRYKHIKREGSDYLHYIDPRVFFNYYKDPITKWCERLEKDIIDKYPNLAQYRVLIISPGKQFNAYYTETINRIIFKDTANIIQYEIDGDFIENDKKFFYPDINSADLIFYADDFCESGKTFHAVNNFVKHCRRESEDKQSLKGNYGFNGAFFLINKTDQNAFADILQELKQSTPGEADLGNRHFFSFYNLCVHSLKLPDGRCPVCMELEKYKQLADTSMLDTITHYYLNKKLNLNPEPPEKGKREPDNFGFNPLVSGSGDFPWVEGNKIENASAKWELYRTGRFPERHYANMLLHHELNLLLRSDKTICRKVLETSCEAEPNEKEIEKLKGELERCVTELLKSYSIKTTFYELQTSENHSLLNQLAYFQTKENFLKILTHPPFVNTISIRQKVFKWVLIEIDKLLNEMVRDLPASLPSYTQFRYLKFLMRRTTRLGSNYLIRGKTLGKFRKLYSCFGEVYNSIDKQENNFKRNEKKCDPNEADAAKKNEYVQKVRNLITHKKAVLQEFSYYYVALIKELNLDNEAKSIRLDGNVEKLFKGIDCEVVSADSEPYFYYLLGLLKLENVEVLQQGMSYLAEHYISNIPALREKAAHFSEDSNAENSKWVVNQMIIELSKADSDYKLENLKRFLFKEQEQTLSQWAKQKNALPYLRCLYIMAFLKVEESLIVNVSLDDKAKAILFNIYRMFEEKLNFNEKEDLYEKTNSALSKINDVRGGTGAFLAVKYNNVKSEYTRPSDLVLVKATESNLSESDWMTMEIGMDNIVYDFINGISGRRITSAEGNLNPTQHPFKPWTFLEFTKTGKEGKNGVLWQSDWGKIYKKPSKGLSKSILDEDEGIDASNSFLSGFAEQLYVPDSTEHILFFRIAGTEEKVEVEKGEIRSSIQNISRAVFCIYGKKSEAHLDVTRLLLMLKPELLMFLKKHYETDSLRELVGERDKTTSLRSFSHGTVDFIDGLFMLGKDKVLDKDKELHKLFYSQTKLKSNLQAINDRINHRNISENELLSILSECDYHPSRIDFNDYLLSLTKYALALYQSEISGSKTDVQCNFNSKVKIEVKYYLTILNCIFFELFRNAKKRIPFPDEDEPELSLQVSEDDDGFIRFELENNCSNVYLKGNLVKKLNRQAFIKSEHGLGLVSRVLTTLGCPKPEFEERRKDDNNSYFKIIFKIIPIRVYEK